MLDHIDKQWSLPTTADLRLQRNDDIVRNSLPFVCRSKMTRFCKEMSSNSKINMANWPTLFPNRVFTLKDN